MKILIAGSDFNAVLLAQYLKLQDPNHDIYITTAQECEDDSYTPIKIRENDIPSICDFVKYNQIEFTIVTSQLAIINGIADTFKKESFPIFAPFAEAARITFFNSIAKKIMYKLKINTPKFGIFDRENLALEYIRRSKFPLVVSNDFTLVTRERNVYETFSKAKIGLQKTFEARNEKVIIENYIDLDSVHVYFITDGFNALPLVSIEKSQASDFSTITAPSQKLSEDLIVKILRTAIYPLLDDISKYAGSYVGIIGLEIKVAKDNFCVLEFYNGFQEYDFQAFLSLLNENLIDLLYDTANGCLADNHDYVKLTNKFSYTVSINKQKLEKIYEDLDNDYIESYDKNKVVLTNMSSTLNYTKESLLDYLETICDKEIFEKIIDSEMKKAIRI